MSTGFCAFEAIHPLGDSATQPLARLGGRLALSLRLAGMGLPPRRFAPAIPSGRTRRRLQRRLQG